MTKSGKINWSLEHLKSHLNQRDEIKDWIVTEEHTHRRERYFMAEGSHLVTDQDRNVHSRNLSVRLFVKLSKPGRQGEIAKKLFTALPLEHQINQAIETALQTDHQAWELSREVPSQIPEVSTTDPRMAEDLDSVMEEATRRIQKAVLKSRDTQFNSAELFLSVHHKELHLSTGLTHRSSQSRVYTEAAYSYSRPGKNNEMESDEYLSSQWAVNLDDLPFEKLFDDTSDHARSSLDVIKPVTGKYPVIIDSEVLSTLLNSYFSHLTAANSYSGLPFYNVGAEFIPEARGDLLSITLDPSLEFGADTAAISEQGLIQKPLLLVNENKVVATAADKQYGDYLGIPTTTIRGNLVVTPGQNSYKDLSRMSSKVIEILQFSGLFADSNSGTFSSEIRLARLYDNQKGTVSYIKGGSLSGSINENFKGLKLSNEKVKRAHFSSDHSRGQGYYGPEYALLSDVSIVG